SLAGLRDSCSRSSEPHRYPRVEPLPATGRLWRNRAARYQQVAESCTHLNACPTQLLLELPDDNCTGVEHAGGQRGIDLRPFEYFQKMPYCARAARCNERYPAELAHRAELLDIVPVADTVIAHTVENDFTRAAILYFAHPFEYVAAGLPHLPRVP